jgi:hypothetical protein
MSDGLSEPGHPLATPELRNQPANQLRSPQGSAEQNTTLDSEVDHRFSALSPHKERPVSRTRHSGIVHVKHDTNPTAHSDCGDKPFLDQHPDALRNPPSDCPLALARLCELPPIVIADLFGIHPGTAHAWAKFAQASWTGYLAAGTTIKPAAATRNDRPSGRTTDRHRRERGTSATH